MRHPSERGNILFLILLAVVLFAALSYAVTSSMRGGGNDASQEVLKTEVSKIEQFGMQIRTALQRMTMIGGYKLWQIDYSKTNYSFSTANPNCTGSTCKLHDTNGGAVEGYLIPAKYITDSATCSSGPAWGGKYSFINQTIKGIGIETQRDLVLAYGGVTRELCKAINDANGIAQSGLVPPLEQYLSQNYLDYTGNLSAEITLTDTQARLGDQATAIAGKQMFCLRESGTNAGCNRLYFILVER